MKACIIGVSAYDTLIEIGDFPKLKSDMSLWANHVHYALGGTGAGKALAFDALGVQTRLITDMGHDDMRDKMMKMYSQTGIDLKVLDADISTSHTNIMHGQGQRLSIFTSMAKMVDFDPTIEADIIHSDFVCLSINDYCRSYIPYIKKHKKLCFVDIHDYDMGNPYHQDFIDVADILFVSGVNIDNHIDFLKAHKDQHRLIILTKAERGSLLINQQGQIIEQSAFKGLKLVDTNGAGDSFSVGFMYAYMKKKPLAYCMKFASICGALACSSRDLCHKDMTEALVIGLMDQWDDFKGEMYHD